MSRRLVIVGASGHGKVIADIANKSGYEEIVFLDDDQRIGQCSGYPVVGKVTDFERYLNSDVFVAVGNAETRQKLHNDLKNHGITPITLIHPSAVIGRDVRLGNGTVVMAGAVINPDVEIGEGCIINTCSSVDHDCTLAGFVHVAVGSHIAGNVQVGERTWIGAGVTVSNNIVIGSDCMIGAGAVVVKNIMEQGCYVGIPAKRLKS